MNLDGAACVNPWRCQRPVPPDVRYGTNRSGSRMNRA